MFLFGFNKKKVSYWFHYRNICFLFVLIRKFLSKIGQKRLDALRWMYRFVSEAFGATKEIKVIGLENTFVKRFSKPKFLRNAVENFIGIDRSNNNMCTFEMGSCNLNHNNSCRADSCRPAYHFCMCWNWQSSLNMGSPSCLSTWLGCYVRNAMRVKAPELWIQAHISINLDRPVNFPW